MGVGERGLPVGQGLGGVQILQLFRGRLPTLEGFELLGRELPLTQLLKQRFDLVVAFDVRRLADQHVDTLDVEATELPLQLIAGFLLDLVPFVQQPEHRLGVGDVAEVRAEHRVECLRDQLLHVAEALNDARRPLVVDVHDHA